MALQRPVHAPVEHIQVARVETQQRRPQLAQAGPCPVGIGWQIEGPQGADLAPAGQADVRVYANHGAVEDRHRLAFGPVVAAFMEGQVHLMDG